MSIRNEYVIRGRRVGTIGVVQDIIVLRAQDKEHAEQRAVRLYEEGWEHIQLFAVAPDYRPDLDRA